MTTGRALIILGHGSHLNPDSSAPVYAHAARIRGKGSFDEVLEAFWKEEPSLPDAIDLVESEDVVVVPLFLAEGYFTRDLIPRELGITPPVERVRGKVVRYARPVGAQPQMSDLLLQRAFSISGLDAQARRDAALVIIGHGTNRSSTSGDTVYDLVYRIRQTDQFGEVTCGFLDEEPEIGKVIAGIDSDSVVLVPYFAAEGWHTRDTIPADLELTGSITRRGNRTIWYTDPVGTMPEIADIIEEIGIAALAEGPTPLSADSGAAPVAELTVARSEFFDWLDAEGDRWKPWLQLAIRRVGKRYHLVHLDDAERGFGGDPLSGALSDSVPELFYDGKFDDFIAAGSGAPSQILPTSNAIRAAALELVRFNAAGEYRPLRTAPDLVRGWYIRGLDASDLWHFLSIVYPASVLHWHRSRQGTERVTGYRDWAARQTAMYASVKELPDEAVRMVVNDLCRDCLRTRFWTISADDVGEPAGSPTVACPEPCTVFATEARQASPDA